MEIGKEQKQGILFTFVIINRTEQDTSYTLTQNS